MELPRPLGAWADTFETLVSTFIAQDEEDARDIQVLRGQIRSLRRMEELAGFMILSSARLCATTCSAAFARDSCRRAS